MAKFKPGDVISVKKTSTNIIYQIRIITQIEGSYYINEFYNSTHNQRHANPINFFDEHFQLNLDIIINKRFNEDLNKLINGEEI